MSPFERYYKIFEHYDYEAIDSDYHVFDTRLAFNTIKIYTHFNSSDIRILVNESNYYFGKIDNAPDLNPHNILVEYGKTTQKKNQDSFLAKVKKVYSTGYNLTNFLMSSLDDLLTYKERIHCFCTDDKVVNYFVEFNKYKSKILAYLHCTTINLDKNGNILSTSKQNYQCSLSTVEVLQDMHHDEIFEVLIEQAAVSNVATMVELRPYLRKCAIDKILRTL